VQESEAPMSSCVGQTLVRGGSVVMRRAATGGKEAGEGGGEAGHWPCKPKRNKSSLVQIESKTPKATRTKENAMTK
jgi:hypothetical protein